jgi:hypothetical protein
MLLWGAAAWAVSPLLQWAGAYRGPALVCYEGPLAEVGDGGALPAGLSDAVSAVEAQNAAGWPVRYETRSLGARQLIVAADAPLLLDTRIDLAPGVRSADEALGQWTEALYAETGQRVLPDLILDGQATTDAGGSDRSARELLAEILDDHGPDKVWSLVWYEAGQYWMLNVRVRWDLRQREPLAAPTVWHSQPPGTPLRVQPPPDLDW